MISALLVIAAWLAVPPTLALMLADHHSRIEALHPGNRNR
jgi:hypothetical protein